MALGQSVVFLWRNSETRSNSSIVPVDGMMRVDAGLNIPSGGPSV